MSLLSDDLLFFTGRYEVYRRSWFAYEKLEGMATLELEQEQHNSLDRFQKGSKNQQPCCLWQRLHWTWSDWRVIYQQLPTVWASNIGLFRADTLARHLLLLAYDSSVGTVDQTYLIEHVRDLKLELCDEIGQMLKVSTNSTNVSNYLYTFLLIHFISEC